MAHGKGHQGSTTCVADQSSRHTRGEPSGSILCRIGPRGPTAVQALEAAPFDERIETPGGLFFVDGASVLYLIGSRMNWVEDDFTAGFVFANPNAKGACGCGESFTV